VYCAFPPTLRRPISQTPFCRSCAVAPSHLGKKSLQCESNANRAPIAGDNSFVEDRTGEHGARNFHAAPAVVPPETRVLGAAQRPPMRSSKMCRDILRRRISVRLARPYIRSATSALWKRSRQRYLICCGLNAGSNLRESRISSGSLRTNSGHGLI
jgi:hypothetical protein